MFSPLGRRRRCIPRGARRGRTLLVGLGRKAKRRGAARRGVPFGRASGSYCRPAGSRQRGVVGPDDPPGCPHQLVEPPSRRARPGLCRVRDIATGRSGPRQGVPGVSCLQGAVRLGRGAPTYVQALRELSAASATLAGQSAGSSEGAQAAARRRARLPVRR